MMRVCGGNDVQATAKQEGTNRATARDRPYRKSRRVCTIYGAHHEPGDTLRLQEVNK